MARAIDWEEERKTLKNELEMIGVNAEYTDFEAGVVHGIEYCINRLDLAPTLTPPNEPLTWDELGTMIEKPVYIVEMENGKSYWALVYTVGDTGTLLASAIDLNDYGDRELYGKSWLAYCRPPEGET